jgi:tRNA-dihydrouridine synthase
MLNFWKNLQTPFTALAPMDDVTDVVFRELVAEIAKPDVLFTEFVSADGLVRGNREKVEKKLAVTQNQHPIVAQIWGSTPENFLKAAQIINELGFDGIDINMACPARAVMAKKSGAALIGNIDTARELILAVKQGANNLPVSVKTRLNKTTEATYTWLEFLLNQDLAAITLHARTAKELSKVDAHWDEIGKLVELRNKLSPTTLIIGNGDVKSYAEVLQKHKDYGVNGVMIGRGIFNNPWVFAEDQTPQEHTTADYINLLLRHNKMFYQRYGDTKYFETLKKFFKMYIKNFKGADQLRQTLMMCKNYQQVNDTIAKWNFPPIKN